MATIVYEGPDETVEEQYADENIRIHIDAGLFHLKGETDSKYVPRERVYSWEFETERGEAGEELANYIQ